MLNDKFTNPSTMRIMKILHMSGAESRFAGGCVRDAFLGRDFNDIDIATELPPPEVMRLFQKSGIKVVPTGIDHGTVTVVIDHKPYEITTLRQDVECHGRHATVEFTTDWSSDAHRRDFTMNALYCDLDGKIYDFVDGLTDLKNRHVRFVGDAHDRIREDALRILRFFRFRAHYDKGPPENSAIAACHDLSSHIDSLSGERLQIETLKLLGAPNPAPFWQEMSDAKLVSHFMPSATQIDHLARLSRIETELGLPPDPLRRLAALGVDADAVRDRLKLSNKQSARLSRMVDWMRQPDTVRPRDRRDPIYADFLLLRAEQADEQLTEKLADNTKWQEIHFPLRGRDILAVGGPGGRIMGDALAKTENWWAEHEFKPSHDECLAWAMQYLGIKKNNISDS